MNRTSRHPSAGFTLVEMIAATAMLAVLTTSSFALVRTANDAWRRHRDDSQSRREAIAALQHVVRRVRQATQVTAISTAADTSGFLTLQMADGTSALWDHVGGSSQVLYGTTTANNLLAENITQASFIGLTASGLAQTTDPAKIHAVRCQVTYAMSRPTGPVNETVSCTAWLRAW
jgi:prepilin-type N-terminal cleavage/methylation domain-containing protein